MNDQLHTKIDPPARPPGWEDAAERLYSIRLPDGGAVAWVCPEIGGNTIAYAARLGDRWVQIFDVAPPATLRETPSRYGLPVLFPFPGNMRNGRYQWGGQEHVVPPTYPTGSDPDGANIVIHGFAHIRPWRFVEQDADRVVCEFRTPDALDPARAASYPFTVRLTHEIQLGPDGLTSVLTAENQGDETAPLAFGLHPYFGADVLGPDRSQVQVELPGRSERVREAVEPGRPPAMTGRREPVPAGPVSVVPLGETMIASRTDFPPATAVARVVNLAPIDGRTGWSVVLSMGAGYRDLLLFAPPVQSSISIEPQTHMPGGASLPEGHPDGLVGLAPGAKLEATAHIQLVPPGGHD
jgi:aldose 1-epimerase